MHVLVLFACFVGVVCMREIERDREREVKGFSTIASTNAPGKQQHIA